MQGFPLRYCAPSWTFLTAYTAEQAKDTWLQGEMCPHTECSSSLSQVLDISAALFGCELTGTVTAQLAAVTPQLASCHLLYFVLRL